MDLNWNGQSAEVILYQQPLISPVKASRTTAQFQDGNNDDPAAPMQT